MAEVVLTLKGGTGYDAPWLVLHGETEEEISILVNAFGMENAYASAVHAIIEANALADVKATLGATEEKPTPPVRPSEEVGAGGQGTLATNGQLLVLKKRGIEAKEGLTQAEAASLIAEGSKK